MTEFNKCLRRELDKLSEQLLKDAPADLHAVLLQTVKILELMAWKVGDEDAST